MTETRAPYSADDYIEMIKVELGVNTSADAYNAVKELRQRQPLVWHDGNGRLGVAAGLTVRQIVQVVAALEGLTVK